MKKFSFFVLITMMAVSFPDFSFANGENYKLSGNPRGLIGKIISFEDGRVPSLSWSYRIVGVHYSPGASNGKITLFVANGVKYLGFDVREISFNPSASGDWWQISYYFPNFYKNSIIMKVSFH
ncbi:hypothetical protein A2442_00430 [Candidatus Campbellbacteria bacterium RIFOXYC2_FULL_35_25]|uniref:Uncharacterized protein n=1 Tax=Candidatus Campbellbacteria bacterium RIFOXYC2_FULL_35_25 TaxID=1797582 RepID=A0A1F5EI29_9BACT|nr:MAG: hypothetical protein A2442_00430 [Candidatus Campbellbacteria bacterium RIFOXYC2_FULL_35_25]